MALAFFLSREDKGANPLEAPCWRRPVCRFRPPAPGAGGLPLHNHPGRPPVGRGPGPGSVESGPDADGIYRRVPLVLPFKDRWLPLLPFAAFQRFGNQEPLNSPPVSWSWGP